MLTWRTITEGLAITKGVTSEIMLLKDIILGKVWLGA